MGPFDVLQVVIVTLLMTFTEKSYEKLRTSMSEANFYIKEKEVKAGNVS